jgi:hypothetical protein
MLAGFSSCALEMDSKSFEFFLIYFLILVQHCGSLLLQIPIFYFLVWHLLGRNFLCESCMRLAGRVCEVVAWGGRGGEEAPG